MSRAAPEAAIGAVPTAKSLPARLTARFGLAIEVGVSRFGSVTDNLTRMRLRRYNIEGAVQIRQMGGTTEMAAAFQRRQIDGAVMATVRVNAPTRMLVDLAELGIRYSNVVIATSRDDYRRNPEIIEAMVRAYLEGVAGGRPAQGKSATGHSEVHPTARSEIDPGALRGRR